MVAATGGVAERVGSRETVVMAVLSDRIRGSRVPVAQHNLCADHPIDDLAGLCAAIALAERLGGIIDHMHSDAVLRDLDVMREAGMMVTTLNEARLRADTVVVIGAGPFTRPELTQDLLAAPTAPEIGDHVKRRVFWLCPGRSHAAVTPANGGVRRIGRGADELPAVLAALRARTAGR